MYSMISPSPALEKGQASDHPTFSLRRTSAPTYTLLRRVAIFVALLVALFILPFRGSTADAGLIVRLAAYKLIQGINPLEAAFLDATRSRQHKATLRPSITYELHSLESTGVFADWYGNPDEVGLSPFDYVVPPEWQGRLVGRNKWSVASHTDCASSPDVEICDLASALRSSAYRIVDLIKPGHWMSWTTDAVLQLAAEMPADVPPTRKSSIDIRILDECIGKNCTASVSMASGDITLARHAFELVDFFEYGKLKQVHGNFPMQLFGHLPYAADPKRYYPLQNWEDKSIDYLDVDGVLGGSDETHTVTPEEYRQAKLCLFDSTPKKRMSREWVKAMLSGCVIVSDMPTESEEILAEAIIVRDVSATAMDTIQIVEDALKDPMSLQKKALRAFAYARRYHTPAYQAGYILQLSELHREGGRGYDFPLPFAAVCRMYPDGTKPVWC